jgi:hypothetical protein
MTEKRMNVIALAILLPLFAVVWIYVSSIEFDSVAEIELIDVDHYQKIGKFRYCANGNERIIKHTLTRYMLWEEGEKYICYYSSKHPNEVDIDIGRPVVKDFSGFDTTLASLVSISKDWTLSRRIKKRNQMKIGFIYQVNGQDYTRYQVISDTTNLNQTWDTVSIIYKTDNPGYSLICGINYQNHN